MLIAETRKEIILTDQMRTDDDFNWKDIVCGLETLEECLEEIYCLYGEVAKQFFEEESQKNNYPIALKSDRIV